MYDISNTKTQNSLRKYLKKYGTALQYSVYEIHGEISLLKSIIHNITTKYSLELANNDTIVILPITKSVLNKTIFVGNGNYDDSSYMVI